MAIRVKILLFASFIILFPDKIFTQVIFDTINLHEFEIVAIKNDYVKTYKQTAIDTLARKEFEHYDLGQLLSAFSPVFIKSYGKGSVSSASFRGTAASHTKVLWNGFAINSPMLGQVDFSYIPESFFDEVILLFGGGSLHEQSGALGGAVLLNNFAGNKREPVFHINQSVGSFGSYNTSLDINLTKGKISGETSVVLQSSKNNFKYFNNGVLPPEWMIQQNASFFNTGFQQNISVQINKYNRLNVISWNQWNNRNIPPIMTNVHKGGDPEEYQKDFFSRNIIGWKFDKNNNKISVKSAYFFENQHYYLKTTTSEDTTVVTLIDSKNKSSGYYLKSFYKHDFGKGWSLKSGFDILYDVVNSNNYEGGKSRNTESLYAGVTKDFRNKFSFDILLRTDITDGIFLPVMPFAGLNYKVTKRENLFLRSTVSRNYHLPTLNDLYWYPGGNSGLLAEDGLQFDIGANYLKEIGENISVSADVSGYYSFINNWIQWVPSDFRFWTPENIGVVKARGVEVSILISGEMNKIIYRFSGKYAYTKTTDESDKAIEGGYNGRQLIYVPLNHGNTFAYFQYKGWSFSWLTIYTGKRNTTTNPQDDYSNILPYYALNDLQIGKRMGFNKVNLSALFKINNIFNVRYQAVLWRAMPGINFEVSLAADFK